MASLRSKYNHAGLVVNGITLGQPPILAQDLSQPETIAEAYFTWNDSALPSGVIDEAGNIALDEQA